MRAFVVIAALVAVPFASLAQDIADADAAPAAAPRRADWSFGAGVSSGLFLSTAFSSSFVNQQLAVPGVTASLERRLGGRTWLALGVAGAAWRRRDDVPEGTFGLARDDGSEVSVTAGLRQVVTGAGAPVDVSILVLAAGGVARSHQRGVFILPTETEQRLSGWLAGGELGLALDRELVGGLSLRVASPLVGAFYGESRNETTGFPTHTRTDASVHAVLAPRLELRLAF